MCWLPPRVTWQPTLPRCVHRDRPTISPVASLGVRSSTKNEQHRSLKPLSLVREAQRRSESRGPTSRSGQKEPRRLLCASQPGGGQRRRWTFVTGELIKLRGKGKDQLVR